ncbi:hypothetical protein Vi05172_g9657 [Venturia inaequalis]|nr:hypothetical protein Vi05172_g9657 [Venturia inaequalis]
MDHDYLADGTSPNENPAPDPNEISDKSQKGTKTTKTKTHNPITSTPNPSLNHKPPTTNSTPPPPQAPQSPTIPQSATSKVLTTTELLETILTNLPPVQIYLSRQICNPWKATINTSPTLQTRLTLRSKTPPQKTMTWGRGYNPRAPQFVLNPILIERNLLSVPRDGAGVGVVGVGYNDHELDLDMVRMAHCHFPPRWRVERGVGWGELQICDPPMRQVFLRSSSLHKYVCGGEGKGVTAGQVAGLMEFGVGTLYLWHSHY